MPTTPYPIEGVVYDTDGSTLLDGATIIAYDVTSGERTSVTSSSTGEFIVDLANLASGWTSGDKVQLTAIYGSGGAARSLSKRHTVATVPGSYDAGNMVLHFGSDPFGTCNITFASHCNSSAAAVFVSFYDRTNDALIFRIDNIAATTVSLDPGYLGIKMEGGFIRVFETETSGVSYVVTVVK